MERFAKLLRELRFGSDCTRALEHERRMVCEQFERSAPVALRAEQARLRAHATKALRLGRFVEGPLASSSMRRPRERMLAHSLVLGETGAGKSYYFLHLIRELLTTRTVGSLVVIDPKGELATLLTTRVIPALAMTNPSGANALLDRVVVIDPFRKDDLPALNLLVRDRSLSPELQARDIAEAEQSALEAENSLRMNTIFEWLLRLVIEVGGSMLTVKRALDDPAVLRGLVSRANDRDVVRYFTLTFPHEPKGSLLALSARLQRFLALPMTRRCLGAPSCLDFDRLLEDKITIVNLGSAPAGLASVSRFFGAMVLNRVLGAVFRRAPHYTGRPTVIVVDEWPLLLTRSHAEDFQAVLALARSRKAFLWLANQQLSQLDRHGGELRSVALGQTAIQTLFRLAADDARALRHLLPITGALPRRTIGEAQGFLTPSEELETRVRQAHRLPNRVAYFMDRRESWDAVLLRSATLSLPSERAIPRALVERASRGSQSLSVAALDRALAAEEARLDALAGIAPNPPSPTSSTPPPKPRRRRAPRPPAV